MAEALGTQLARRMKDEIALMRDFVALLRLEQQGLSGNDAEAINKATNAKTILARQLGQIATERNLALAREGLAPNRAGIDALIAVQNNPATLTQLRDALMTLATEADELNRANGDIIRMRMSHNQKAIGALLGTGNGPATYGRDGRSSFSGAASGRHYSAA